MASTGTILNQDAQIKNYERLVSALVRFESTNLGREAYAPLLACHCGTQCKWQTKPVFIDIRGQYGQIVRNVGMVHTSCIREHGLSVMCTKAPPCDMCHARRDVEKLTIPPNVGPELVQAVEDAMKEYIARAIELKTAVAIHQDYFENEATHDPPAKRFQTSDFTTTAVPMPPMPGMTINTTPPTIKPFPIFDPLQRQTGGSSDDQVFQSNAAPKIISAKYVSKCAAKQCTKERKPIEPGENVYWSKGVGVFHLECLCSA